jgi:pimeloyl-ACP methyl ester carboxylesterase
MTITSHHLLSADGTRIAFERTGRGPAVILVEPAGHYRQLSSVAGLVPHLAETFTVYTYDRRGRGESGDTAPYAPAREVEDLAALIAHAGGRAHVYGYSSGALLALHATAAGLPVERLALLEPPLQDDDAVGPDRLTGELDAVVAAGRREQAVEHFMRSCEVPEEVIAGTRASDSWPKMVSIAHTLVYDCMVSDAMTPEVVRGADAETLVLDSASSTDDLTGWAATVASRLPNATHRSLPGQWHGVDDDVLAPVLIDFFGG